MPFIEKKSLLRPPSYKTSKWATLEKRLELDTRRWYYRKRPLKFPVIGRERTEQEKLNELGSHLGIAHYCMRSSRDWPTCMSSTYLINMSHSPIATVVGAHTYPCIIWPCHFFSFGPIMAMAFFDDWSDRETQKSSNFMGSEIHV